MPERTTSNRGFQGLRLVPSSPGYKHRVYVECSSAIDFRRQGCLENPGSSYLWIGCESMASGERVAASHVDHDEVRALITALEHWLQTGELHT